MLQTNASQCFLSMDGLIPLYLTVTHVTHHKHSQGVMQAFSVNCITSSSWYPQSNGLAERYVQILKCLFNKAKEEGKDFFKCLMFFCSTPLTGSLQGRSARSDLPMSNAARNQHGIQTEVLKNIDKDKKLPTHDLHVGQHVMYQDSVSK